MTQKKSREFSESCKNLKETQLKKMLEITGVKSYEDFTNNFSLSKYGDYKEEIEHQKICDKTIQFVPTSGSSENIKWIPYTKKLKEELFNASSVWLYDLYSRHEGIDQGLHYWSLSWLPEELRTTHHVNDLNFFGGIERFILSQTLAQKKELLSLKSMHESMLETLIMILNNKVTVLSVWSPTFLIELLNLFLSEKKMIQQRLKDKEKINCLINLKEINSVNLKIFFPHLRVISSWDTGNSHFYAEKLKKLFNFAIFEGKGLWATEGVVTFPLKQKYVLAINSHFYEFLLKETQQIIPAWKLEIGMVVSPLLTTSSGFKRYLLDDYLVVDGFIDEAPTLTFLGRSKGVDMVGEKMSVDVANKILLHVRSLFDCFPVSLIAVLTDRPYYCLLIEKKENQELITSLIEDSLELILTEHFHYKLARELEQLGKSRVRVETDAYLTYINCKERMGMIKGNIKIEPLVLLNELDLRSDVI